MKFKEIPVFWGVFDWFRQAFGAKHLNAGQNTQQYKLYLSIVYTDDFGWAVQQNYTTM